MTASVVQRFLAHVEHAPDRDCWRHLSADAPRVRSYAAVARRAGRFARALRDAGIARGGVVPLFLPHHPDAVPALLGAMMAGAIPAFMPCPSPKQRPELYWPAHRQLLQRIDAAALLTTAAQAAEMAAFGLLSSDLPALLVEEIDGEDEPRDDGGDGAVTCLLQHSSGTTALKKGVALSHDAILRQVDRYSTMLGMGAEDRIASWLPLYHDMGFIACTVAPLVNGQSVTALSPFDWVARPVSLFDAIVAHGGEFVWLPNFAFEHLARSVGQEFTGDLSGVRAFINCSEPCKPGSFDRFLARFRRNGVRPGQLQVCYAMAETVFAVSQTSVGAPPREVFADARILQAEGRIEPPVATADGIRLLSAGKLLPGLQLRTVADGIPVEESRVGEIQVAGDFLFDGYHHDPATTAERLRDGWYATRDRGVVLDGELFVLGRVDDLVIVNGRNIHAHEIEDLASHVPGLKPGRAVAFGVFDPAIGSEALVVVAETEEDAADAAALRRELFERIGTATGIDPAAVRIVAPGWLAKTTSGKVSREANRARFLAEREAGPDAGPAPGTPPVQPPPPAKPGRMGFGFRRIAPVLPPAPGRVAVAKEPKADDLLGRIAAVIGRCFRVPATRITAATVAADIDGWDSLAHTTVMLEIERNLGIAFKQEELFAFQNVGAIAECARQRLVEGGEASHRVLYASKRCSLVGLGGDQEPGIIIFAGLAQKFAGLGALDFASVLFRIGMGEHKLLFATDLERGWYTGCTDELVAAIEQACPGPKVILGNSMGGYGTLRFAPLLHDVQGVLSFVPQARAPRRVSEGRPLLTAVRADTPTCIVFGEHGDELAKDHYPTIFNDPALHRIVRVPNCSHSAVRYLNEIGELDGILRTILTPHLMLTGIPEIAARIPPDPTRIARREKALRAKAARRERRVKAARRKRRRG